MRRTLVLAGCLVLAAVATSAPAADSGGTKEQGLVTSEFGISGMTCGGCAAGVKLTVKKLEGVTDVEASYEKSNAIVTYDPAKVTAEQIEDAIKKLGYEAEQKKPQKSESSSNGSAASGALNGYC